MDTLARRHQSTGVYTGRDPKVRPQRPHFLSQVGVAKAAG